MNLRRAVVAAAPATALAMWLLLASWWTHAFRAFTNFSAARLAAGPVPRSSPPLRVVDQHGVSWDVASPSSQYRLVQAMYLRCPDLCPVAMARLGLLARNLGDMIPDRLRIVSLDVEGDPPSALHEMWVAHGSHEGWTMASLAEAPVDATLRRLGVWIQRRPDGLINHGLDLLLLDPTGDVVDVMAPEEDEGAMADRIRRRIR